MSLPISMLARISRFTHCAAPCLPPLTKLLSRRHVQASNVFKLCVSPSPSCLLHPAPFAHRLCCRHRIGVPHSEAFCRLQLESPLGQGLDGCGGGAGAADVAAYADPQVKRRGCSSIACAMAGSRLRINGEKGAKITEETPKINPKAIPRNSWMDQAVSSFCVWPRAARIHPDHARIIA